MRKFLAGLFLFCGIAFSQSPLSKLSGKTIYIQRQEGGSGEHTQGFIGFKDFLMSYSGTYGYRVEFTSSPLTVDSINKLFARLYRLNGTKPANPIDVMIFCQGEGDWNVTGNPILAGSVNRMSQINAHVRSGGALMIVHAAGGRSISRSGWIFGAMLMTDWFLDEYLASPAHRGNSGHFSSGTPGTISLDVETKPLRDSSTYFIRNLMMLGTNKKGFAMPESTNQVTGEWYDFNGGYLYEDTSGGRVSNQDNKFVQARLRGHAGYPDSGIGPVKMLAAITNIVSNGNYAPPYPGRPSVWGHEVSIGKFDKNTPDQNGRFVYFNPGHLGTEFTVANGNGWVANLFLSALRWAVKDDRGCMNPASQNYNSLATVNVGCITTSIGHDALLQDQTYSKVGSISVNKSGINIDIVTKGPHSVKVIKISGEQVYKLPGSGPQNYQVTNLQVGFYMVQIMANGQSFIKKVSIE